VDGVQRLLTILVMRLPTKWAVSFWLFRRVLYAGLVTPV
jgi:hypothetical protein